jgi:hypothetical protein
VFLCSLSNFDAYFITRLHKSPRPFAFSVKSTDNLSFFENKADYLHVFCCGEKEGNVWMEKILVARVSATFMHCVLVLRSDAFVISRMCCIKKNMSSSTRKRLMVTLQAVLLLVLVRGRHHQLAHHHKHLLLLLLLTPAHLCP